MLKMMISRAIATVLVLAAPLPALAQAREGVMFPAATFQTPSTPAAKTKDPNKDSVKNGAIIGAIVLGTWCAIVCGQGLDSAGQLPLVVAANAGLGALIGAGIDASFSRSPRVLFRLRF